MQKLLFHIPIPEKDEMAVLKRFLANSEILEIEQKFYQNKKNMPHFKERIAVGNNKQAQ